MRCRQQCQDGSGQPCLRSNASVPHAGPGTASPSSLLATAPQDLPVWMLRRGGHPSLVPGNPQKDGITHAAPVGLRSCQGTPQLPCCFWVQRPASRGVQAGNPPWRFPRHFSGCPHCPEPPAWGAEPRSESTHRAQQVDGERRCRRQRRALQRGCHPCLSLLSKGRKPNWGRPCDLC